MPFLGFSDGRSDGAAIIPHSVLRTRMPLGSLLRIGNQMKLSHLQELITNIESLVLSGATGQPEPITKEESCRRRGRSAPVHGCIYLPSSGSLTLSWLFVNIGHT